MWLSAGRRKKIRTCSAKVYSGLTHGISLKVESCLNILGTCSIDQEVVEQQEWQEKTNLEVILWQNAILVSHSRDEVC